MKLEEGLGNNKASTFCFLFKGHEEEGILLLVGVAKVDVLFSTFLDYTIQSPVLPRKMDALPLNYGRVWWAKRFLARKKANRCAWQHIVLFQPGSQTYSCPGETSQEKQSFCITIAQSQALFHALETNCSPSARQRKRTQPISIREFSRRAGTSWSYSNPVDWKCIDRSCFSEPSGLQWILVGK